MKKLLFTALAVCVLSGCGQVSNYETGFFTRFGKVVGSDLGPGLHFYNPLVTILNTYDLRETVSGYKAEVFTKDIQSAVVNLSVTYSLNRKYAVEIYSTVGGDYARKLLDPVAISVLKDVFGDYEAGEIIESREKITDTIESVIRSRLAPKGVLISKVNIINIDFSDAFEKAVEDKQVALQASIRAKNETIRISEEGKQAVIKAKAEAESIRIKTEALAKGKQVIMLEAIEKWDGKLPKIVSSDILPIVEGREK